MIIKLLWHRPLLTEISSRIIMNELKAAFTLATFTDAKRNQSKTQTDIYEDIYEEDCLGS
jgi:hypothetical protein